jgi:DNA-binding response OmpR family regulator
MPCRILIIDDEELERDSLEYLLAREQCELHFAEDGETGLERAKALQPDLILLDVLMPGIDGFEVCRQLRQDKKLAEVPVILITGLEDPLAKVQGLDAGADDFVGKPFQPVELRARVRSITRLNRYRRLMAERNKFSWAIESSYEAYVLLDLQQRIISANPQAKVYLQLEHVDLEQEIIEFLSWLDKQGYECQPQPAWENWPQPTQDEETGKRYLVRPESVSSKALWLEVENLPLPQEESVGQILVRLRDVSAEITLQQQAWSFHRLLAHKLRTPMMGMQILQLLRGKIENQEDKEMLRLLDLVIASANRQERQLNHVLNYIDSPQLCARNEIESFGLAETDNLVERLQQELTHIELNYQFDPVLQNYYIPLSLHGLEVIIRELLHNASKFHPHNKPTVTLSLNLSTANQCRLTCKDNGIMIPAEELSKVWLPYYQIEKGFTGEIEGMGLGLSQIAAIVWSTGGRCALYNCRDTRGVLVDIVIPAYLSRGTKNTWTQSIHA